jgi:hypothetical protein
MVRVTLLGGLGFDSALDLVLLERAWFAGLNRGGGSRDERSEEKDDAEEGEDAGVHG